MSVSMVVVECAAATLLGALRPSARPNPPGLGKKVILGICLMLMLGGTASEEGAVMRCCSLLVLYEKSCCNQLSSRAALWGAE